MTKALASSAQADRAEVLRLTAALTQAQSDAYKLAADAGTFLARATTAEARVRELEQENERLTQERDGLLRSSASSSGGTP